MSSQQLREYARKRDFSKTPEPAPAASDKPPGRLPFFCVQRHDATRLHYDFRLEIGGVLKSWAIPKGPSLDPDRKVLAVMVEDHPIEYGMFEGNIPEGNYGAGSVMLWDYGHFELLGEEDAETQLKRGDLKFRLHGQKLKGEFALVRMKGRGKGNEWLLIKKRDGHEVPDYDVEDYAWSVKTGRTQEEIARELPATFVPASQAARRKTERKAGAKKARGGRETRRSSPDEPEEDDEGESLVPSALPGAVARAMPSVVVPMMAQPAEAPPRGPGWVYEVKLDGLRTIAFLDSGHVRLASRTGLSYNRQFPELLVLGHHIHAQQAVVDGEICVLDERGRPQFELVAPRVHQTSANAISHLARRSPARLFLFDVLYCDGWDLRGCKLEDRRRLLERIVKPGDAVGVSAAIEADGEQMLEAARAQGLEGVIAKKLDSKYEPRRSNAWLKLKVTHQQEFVICGFTHGERKPFSSLILGVYDKGHLEWVGNVGTGFNSRKLEYLWNKLQPLIQTKCPFTDRPAMLRSATWVEPKLVCECKFAQWTKDGKLRAPVFVDLRDDKKPEECVREPLAVASQQYTPQRGEGLATAGRLIPPGLNETALEIDGRLLQFTNLNKIFYPREKYTKRDILNYYDAVAHLILPHLRDRPLSLKRYPDGIGGEYFFQKNIPEGYPSWLRLEPIHSEHRGEPIHYVICNDRATLLYLVNLGCIDHNPWMSRIGSLESPDFILIDLDPQGCGFDKIIEAALLIRQRLRAIGLEGYPKTTGGDGMHIYVPIEPRYSYDQARTFAEILAALAAHDAPHLFTTPRTVDKRKRGRVYFDYLQISSGKTVAAPYVLRAFDGAPVATPLRWEEVQPGLTPREFHLGNVLERFEKTGDLFAGVLQKPQRLEPALARLRRLVEQEAQEILLSEPLKTSATS